MLERLLVGLLLAGLPASQSTRPAPAVALPGNPGRAAANQDEFGVLQVTTDDPDRLEAEWAAPGAGAYLTSSTRTTPNHPLFTYIVFHGCRPNASGECDLTADFIVYGPDGKISQQERGVSIWHAKAPNPPQNLHLGSFSLGFGTDDKGPFGDFRMVVAVTDNIAHITLTTEQTLRVDPAN